jgi:signal transduction histidine kinase
MTAGNRDPRENPSGGKESDDATHDPARLADLLDRERRRSAYLEAKIEAHDDEIQALRELATHSVKMAALGELLAGVAHEIRTPIGAVNASHDVFVRTVSKLREAASRVDGEPRQAINALLDVLQELNRVNADAIGRVLKIVRGLSTFVRREEGLVKEVDIHGRIEDSLTLIHHQIKNRIEVVRDYGADVPSIGCYPDLINQVLLNIMVNAVHAIEGEGRIVIRTRQAQGGIQIDITDTGSGMTPEVMSRIYEPGFTTKETGRGTGLGLPISRQIVERHGGRIEVRSEVGKGSTFSIFLPQHCADAPSAESSRREESQ